MRLFLALLVGKLIFLITRFLKVGGGSAAPGLYALKIEPDLVRILAKQIPQNVVITGTNGKTTTARILNHLCKSQNLKIIRNSSGSNLERGIASALISKSSLFGRINNINLGIWEADEAAFNTLIPKIRPQIILILNVFRDQLDRYGEIDSIVKKWEKTLERLDFEPKLIVNGNDPKIDQLIKHPKVKGESFILKDHSLKHEGNKKFKAGKANFEAKLIKNLGLEGTLFNLNTSKETLTINLPTPGIYHIYDFLGAFAVYYNLNLPIDKVPENILDFKPAFGRVEEIKINDNQGFIFLIKNPVGANSVFETIQSELKEGDRLFILLNDNFADGTDVSWIWDAQFEELKTKSEKCKVIVSGNRAEDMALRLKYAGFEAGSINIKNSIELGLEEATKGLKGRLFILPTYTAMLEIQRLLTKKGLKKHYWKDS